MWLHRDLGSCSPWEHSLSYVPREVSWRLLRTGACIENDSRMRRQNGNTGIQACEMPCVIRSTYLLLQTTKLYHSVHQFIQPILQLITLLGQAADSEISVQNCCIEWWPGLGFPLHPWATAALSRCTMDGEDAPGHRVIVWAKQPASGLIKFPVKPHSLGS